MFHSFDEHTDPHADLVKDIISFPGDRFTLLNVWPEKSFAVPEHTLGHVEGFYIQGLDNLKAERWDAAGAMFRKSLDVATKIVSQTHKGVSLFKRIEELHKAGLITEAMKDWSHEIRLDGNDAVHDEEPETPEDARATQKFAEAFLTYMFTLPSMVAENRAKRDSTNPK